MVTKKPVQRVRQMPHRTLHRLSPADFDLATGGFRFDLRTGLVLLALLGTWYDSRAQRDKQSALDQMQAKQTSDSLAEVKRLQMAQAYDVRSIIVALAERGIVIKETK